MILGVQLGRCDLGNEQKRIVGKRTARMHGHSQERIERIAELESVELVHLLERNVFFVESPKGLRRVHHLSPLASLLPCENPSFFVEKLVGQIHGDGVADVVAVPLYQVDERGLIQIALEVLVSCAGTHVQDDVGPMALALRRTHGVTVDAAAFPLERLIASHRAGDDAHSVGHHERRVKPHAELPDQARSSRRSFASRTLFEHAAPGMGDGPQALFERALVHSHSRVRHDERALISVEGHVYLGANTLVVPTPLVTLICAHQTSLVKRIRRIRDQLAQEHLMIGVN